MNTFVPAGVAYYTGANQLDTKRLVKQLVECQQIYNALMTQAPAHILHHPATQMWAGHLPLLADYACATYSAFKRRFPGRTHKSGEFFLPLRPNGLWHPDWVDELAPIHRARLYEKDPVGYSCFASPPVPPTYPVTKDGKTVDWVVRDGRNWVLRGHPGKTFKTAWAAICFVRGQ